MIGEKIFDAIKGIFGQSKLTEKNTRSILNNIRDILIEGDVSYSVSNSIIDGIKEDIIKGNIDLMKNCSVEDQLSYIIHNKIKKAFGEDAIVRSSKYSDNPHVVLVCGLQGHGKTTSIGKLVNYFKKTEKKEKILVTCCDRSRPAGDVQLKMVTQNSGGFFIDFENADNIINHAKNSIEYAKHSRADVIIIDTAGRQHIQENLIEELKELKKSIIVDEVVLVISALIGQEAKNIISSFDSNISIDSLFISMMDSSSRLGSILSVGETYCKKIVWEGIGESFIDIQVFNPTSAADRVLNRPDLLNIMQAAKERISQEEQEDISKKISSGSLNFSDIVKIINMINKMGSVARLMEMMGIKNKVHVSDSSKKIKIAESIIDSMTERERLMKDHLSFSRKQRIAKGSGRTLEDINNIIKLIEHAKKFKNIMNNKNAMNDLMKMMKRR